ncbi:MAG: ubiquinone/menaquinone biosynthesis C-methylase UbiE [Pseudoalteromonas distincta]|jgi:ubiquinone/menaquinone biosynthesis C-methylase UbiE
MKNKTELNKKYWRQLKEKSSIAGISLDETISFEDFSIYGDRLAQKQITMFNENTDQPLDQSSVLDVGCGIGRVLKPFSKRFNSCMGIDINSQILVTAKDYIKSENVELLENDGHSIPFEENRFHFVYSGGVLQHIPEINVIMNYFNEGLRVLKEGGLLNYSIQVCMTLRQGGLEGDRVGAQVLASDIETLLNKTGAELMAIYFDEDDPVPHYNIVIKKVGESQRLQNIEKRKIDPFVINPSLIRKTSIRTGIFEDLPTYKKFRKLWSSKSNRRVTFFDKKSKSSFIPYLKYYGKSVFRLLKKRL